MNSGENYIAYLNYEGETVLQCYGTAYYASGISEILGNGSYCEMEIEGEF